MHIELTDHLRCPRDHDEGYLILLPGRMAGRRVIEGVLACPECGWQTAWSDGVPDFGGAWQAVSTAPLPAEAVPPMLGIEGAGGWIALGGSAARLADELTALLPGVGLVAVNPPEDIRPGEVVQVLRTGTWPIKSHALRGVILADDAARWRDAAIASLLPGRQVIGAGTPPEEAVGVSILASMDNLWVAARR